MYRPPPPTISSRSPLLGIRNWDNGTTTDENGTFQVWGCCGNLCRQPSNQRACRVFFPCPLARGWVAGLARRYCVRALEPVRGGCNLSDSDPSPARCQLKKQTSPTSCSGLGCWSQSFATLPTRKNPARHASLVRQPRPITTRTHPTVGSMSPLPRRLRLVRRTDAIGFQNRRGMRLNRRGGAGIVRLFFSLASNDDVTVGIGAMMEWMSQEPMRPAPSSHCDDKSLLSRPNCSPVAQHRALLDQAISRLRPRSRGDGISRSLFSRDGKSRIAAGLGHGFICHSGRRIAVLVSSAPPPFCLSRPPMTHLHEKLLHEKRHLVRAARSDGHFDGLHRPRNKTSITGWASQPMGGPWWEKPIKKSFEFCRLQNLAQHHAVFFGRHHCQSF